MTIVRVKLFKMTIKLTRQQHNYQYLSQCFITYDLDLEPYNYSLACIFFTFFTNADLPKTSHIADITPNLNILLDGAM